MLERDDMQGLLIHGRIYGCARYLFLRMDAPEQARRWLGSVINDLTTARPWIEPPPAMVNLALTHNGMAALGVAHEWLASFPEEFRSGMPARRHLLGDTGASSPERWQGGMATPDLHAMLLVFARDESDLERHSAHYRSGLAQFVGVHELSAQDARRIPGRKEHFGYQEGISDVILEGTGEEPLPGHGPAIKPGEFVLGYPDETGDLPPMPQPEVLGRNGSYLVYRKLQQDVAGFREFLLREAGIPERVELFAAKLMGRWRSGAPLVLARERDDPELASDPNRNSAFGYADDPQGLACPIGAHIRRVNPRDTLSPSERNRHRLIRRGLPYGPLLPENAPDDGVDRGSAVIFGAASISRQFEFVQRVWINNRKFEGLENDKDPIVGDHDGTTGMTIPRKPFRTRIQGLPRFVTVRGGGYFFMPGIRALRVLAG